MVSAIIPTHNRAHFVTEAIESVLNKSRPVGEIIVIDDGSTDNTRKVLARFGTVIRYLHQKNAGPSAARNHGLRETKGDYIAFLDSDDLWAANTVELQTSFLAQNPSVDFVFADMANFTDCKTVGKAEIKNPAIHDYLVANATNLKNFLECLVIENVVPTPTVMARRSAIEKVGFFNESLRIAEDLDYWIRAAETCRWGFINAVLLHRRRHDSNLISNTNERNLALINVLSALRKRTGNHQSNLREKIDEKTSQIRYDLGSALFKTGSFSDARLHFLSVKARNLRVKCFAKLAAINAIEGIRSIRRTFH